MYYKIALSLTYYKNILLNYRTLRFTVGVLATLITVSILATPALADSPIDNILFVSAGSKPTESVAFGDVNGNGDLNLVVGNDGAGNFTIESIGADTNSNRSAPHLVTTLPRGRRSNAEHWNEGGE